MTLSFAAETAERLHVGRGRGRRGRRLLDRRRRCRRGRRHFPHRNCKE